METPRGTPARRYSGAWGWLAAAAAGAAWEWWALTTRRAETLSEAAWRLRGTRWGGAILGALAAAVVLHIFAGGGDG